MQSKPREFQADRLNHWKIRNDSTNVSHVLSGNHRDCPPGNATKNLPTDAEDETTKKCPCTTCYCRKSPVQSKFNMKQKIDSAQSNKFAPTDDSSHPVKPRITVPSKKVADLNTVQRKSLYQISPKIVYEKRLNNSEGDVLNVETAAPETTSNDSKPAEIVNLDRNLKRLNTFRKENYFECHSTDNLENVQIGDHKCVHKFILNNRLIPQPLNSDPFGTSRCVICDKPMKNEVDVEKEKSNYQTAVFKKKRKSSSNKLINQINITKKYDITEIQIPANFNKFIELFQNTVDNVRKVKPANSVALRHQRGVCLN